MILFLSGVGATIGLALVLGAGYLLGQRKSPKIISSTEEEKLKQKEKDRQFNNLMSYDENKAYERKVK